MQTGTSFLFRLDREYGLDIKNTHNGGGHAPNRYGTGNEISNIKFSTKCLPPVLLIKQQYTFKFDKNSTKSPNKIVFLTPYKINLCLVL